MLIPEYRSISLLKKLKGNPRKIKDSQFNALVTSLKENPDYFEARPVILSDRTGDLVIIAGNMRYEAAKFLKLTVIPTVLLQGLSEEKEREIIIRDNVSNGEWDYDLLRAEWDVSLLDEWGLLVPDIDVSLDPKKATEDQYEIPGTIHTNLALGDLLEIGRHRLVCGDCRETDIMDRLFDGQTADMILTDPPYNVDYTGGSGLKIDNDKMKDGDFRQFLQDCFVSMGMYLKRGGAVYIWHADSEGLNFRQAFSSAGFTLRQCLIWVKNTLVIGRQDYQWKHEPCLYGWKDGAAHYFTEERTHTTVIDDKLDIKKLTKDEMRKMLEEIFSDKIKSSVIYHDKPQKNDTHPTMKPVTLMGSLIENSSKEGEIVADFFGGSGSTMVAGHQLGRTVYMSELSPRYTQVIVDRMRILDPSLRILLNGDEYKI